ncbi:MAG: MATE family efflux transporter [Butyrivibrio crossotus]|nr:MATE family efflux transporter [Butyrivibrio crossotus]
MKKNYEIDMCNGPITGKMLRFALPLMLSSMLQLLFNAADIITVGKFGSEHSLAAVGSNTALINLLTNLFIGLSIGANVLVARFYGAKNGEELNETVHTAMLLSLISGLILTVTGVIFARYFLIWMKTPAEILDLATTYLKIYFLGMPAMMIYNFGSAILRAIGDTKRPLYFLSAAGVINIILNILLVVVFRLDVKGVGIATVISQTVSAILIIRCLAKSNGDIKLELKKLRFSRGKIGAILRIGLPAGLQGSIFSLSNVVIQSSVNIFGPVVVKGNSAAQNLEGFVYFSMNAFHHATLSFTSQNMGAKKYDRLGKILKNGLCLAILFGAGFGGTVILFGRNLLSIYTNDGAAISAGMTRLYIITGTYTLCGIMDVMVGAIRGIGYTVLPTIVSLIGACALRLVWLATVFRIPKFHTINTVYLSYPITWLVTIIAHVICYIIIRKKNRFGEMQ